MQWFIDAYNFDKIPQGGVGSKVESYTTNILLTINIANSPLRGSS